MSEDGEKKNPRELRLSNGRTVIINLNKLSLRDVQHYASIKVPPYEEEPEGGYKGKEKADFDQRMQKRAAVLREVSEIRAKCSDLTTDEVERLGYEDYAVLGSKISDFIINPMAADPN